MGGSTTACNRRSHLIGLHAESVSEFPAVHWVLSAIDAPGNFAQDRVVARVPDIWQLLVHVCFPPHMGRGSQPEPLMTRAKTFDSC